MALVVDGEALAHDGGTAAAAAARLLLRRRGHQVLQLSPLRVHRGGGVAETVGGRPFRETSAGSGTCTRSLTHWVFSSMRDEMAPRA